MTTETTLRPGASLIEAPDAEWQKIEEVLIGGDLARLTSQQRVEYYGRVCRSLGLNPLTRPFDYISLNSKLVLYAKRDATDQLRALRGVHVTTVVPAVVEDLYVVTASGRDRAGRTDTATGAVNFKGLGGEAKANAMMKAETKAKRRLTLSLCGLGFMDESEVGDTTAADVDPTTGQVAPPTGVREALEAARSREEPIADQVATTTAADAEAPAPAEPPSAAPLPRTSDAFVAFVDAHGIPSDRVRATAKSLGYDPKAMTPAELETLAAALLDTTPKEA